MPARPGSAVVDFGALRAIREADALVDAEARLDAAAGLLRYARLDRVPRRVAIAAACQLALIAVAHLDEEESSGAG
jgi:hypothetical protein